MFLFLRFNLDQNCNRAWLRWWLWNKLTKVSWVDSIGNVGLEASGWRIVKQVGVPAEVRKFKLRVTRNSIGIEKRFERSFFSEKLKLEKSRSVKSQQKTTSDRRNMQEKL